MSNFKNTDSLVKKYVIADWVFDSASCQLEKDGVLTKLEPLLCDFLQYLLGRAGQTVTREELLAEVWQGRVVSDDAIRRVVKKLRVALGDDAKNPRYIKTKPLQGYVLVAEVRPFVEPAEADQNIKKIVTIVIAILLASAAVVFALTMDGEAPKTEAEPSLVETQLTSLTGSELSADFHPASQRLLFAVRDYSDEELQLYTKDIGTSFVRRITGGRGNYYGGLFSPSGKQIAYMHQGLNKEHPYTYIADYDPELGLINEQKLDGENAKKSLSSWSSDGRSLYLFGDKNHVDPWEVYRYEIETKTVEQITYSSKQGYGAFYAKESPDGRYLAILKNIFGRRYSLLLMDLSNGSLVSERNLSFFGNSIVWLKPNSVVRAPDGGQADLAISSFKGDLYYYSVADDSLWPQLGTAPGRNDIFYDCGSRCFYMRRHTMNYTDILEINNPFIEEHAKPTMQLESAKAEFHPIYNNSGTSLFYTIKDEKTAAIVKHDLNKSAVVLYSFNPRHIVREISLSPDERYLSGRIEDRLFSLNLETLEFKYLSSELEKIGPPSWSRDSTQIFFARLKMDSSDLHVYQLADGKTVYKSSNTAYWRQMPDGRNFVIDHDLKLYQQQADGKRNHIQDFKHLSGSTWQVHGQYLYFTEFSHGNTYIAQHDLTTNKVSKKILAKNNDSWEFSIHPKGDRLILIRFQTAESDLVKVQWPVPK